MEEWVASQDDMVTEDDGSITNTETGTNTKDDDSGNATIYDDNGGSSSGTTESTYEYGTGATGETYADSGIGSESPDGTDTTYDYGTGATGEEYADTGIGSESDGEFSGTSDSDTAGQPDGGGMMEDADTSEVVEGVQNMAENAEEDLPLALIGVGLTAAGLAASLIGGD